MSGNDGVSAQETRSRTTGRPAFKATEAQRQIVAWLKEAGWASHDQIARAIGISRNTLAKHFKEELAVTAPPAARDQQLDFGGAAHKVADLAAPGRPEHEVTRRNQEKVKLWALHDWSEDRMARQLGISRNTLRKHYASELEFGADAVATEAMLDLKRQSAAGKTAASNKLIEQYRLLVPRTEPAPPPDLGKKAQADIDAKTAHVDTDWGELMH
jgi:DNA-binding CsgD family transcriptional regulator